MGIGVLVCALLGAVGCGTDPASGGEADSGVTDSGGGSDVADSGGGGTDAGGGKDTGGGVDVPVVDAGPCPVDFAPCDDGEPCTIGDRCVGGSCQGGLDLCECQADADCAPTDLCGEQRYCDKAKAPYRCAAEPGSAVV